MKKRTLFKSTYVLLFVLIFFSLKAQERKNQIFVVWENSVMPSQVAQYEDAVKKQVQMMKKYNYKIPYSVYATDEYVYLWVTTISSFTELDTMANEWNKFYTKVKEKENFIQEQEFKGTYNFGKPQVFFNCPELAYRPLGKPFNAIENPYFRMGYCYVKTGSEEEYKANWKQWVDLFKKNNIQIGWNSNTGGFGTEIPLFIWGEFYKNELLC
jgi:hypothetical protein